MVTFLRVLIGAGLLGMGRQLFWLFVGGVGFVFGINFVKQVLTDADDLTIVIAGLTIGLIGAILALVLQRLAVNIAGFFAGGILAVNLSQTLELAHGGGNLLFVFVVGAVIGLVLVTVLFDWALIVLSAVTGTAVILQTFTLARPTALFLYVALTAVGITIQARHMKQE
ncbi:MAG: hypothetical protein ACE5EY_07990 [Anaerolineae bacterium]